MPNCGATSSQYFGLVLYPDECEGHKGLIRYIQEHEQFFEYIMIRHEPEEEGKKPHVHLMYKIRMRSSPTAQVKYWATWVEHVEPIKNPSSYALYMIHQTPESLMSGKKSYSVDDVQGTLKFKENLFGKTAILHNLGKLLNCVSVDCGNISLLIRDCLNDENPDIMLSTLEKYQYLLVNASNQIFNLKK